ncbi:RNA-directed DNA polymerase [Enterococcus faecalis PF3]|nr:RNA-directed DNA polymerase [Enterococcus faecalis PF3]
MYATIFEVPFLVRYGYYDITMKKVESEVIEDDNLEEYYGKPDTFYSKFLNVKAFSDLLKNEDLRSYYNFNKIKNNADTEPINFNIPKNKHTRRLYKVPNLYSYLELCYFVSDNKEDFIKMYKQNIQSTSKFFNQLDFNYEFTKKIEQRLLYGGTNILSLDLSNFYHTLYTHSLPWVIEGKQKSKAKRNGGFANNLDAILQQCQYGETHGVPTGNLVTRMVAELYMCHLDEQLLNKGYKYSRYVDDIKFSFSTETQKEKFLMEFSEVCREYNLILNDKKTEVNTFPFENNRQKMDIFNYFESLNKSTKPEHWIKKISNFWDFCLSEEAHGNRGAIKCIFSVVLNALRFKKVKKEVINEIFSFRESVTEFNLYEKLLDISLKDSQMTNKFITFTEELMEKGLEKDNILSVVRTYLENNKDTCVEKLMNCVQNNWNQEIYQMLLYCVVFEHYSLLSKKDTLNILNSGMDDYSLSLSVILWLKNDWEIFELLNVLDKMLSDTHNDYPKDSKAVGRMGEKLWLFRYFLYYSIIHEVISQDELLAYHKIKYPNVKSDENKDYPSELNKEHAIKVNSSSKKITRFYNDLLSKDIPLVQLGKEDSFIYL